MQLTAKDEQIIREEVFGKPAPVMARFYIDAEKDANASVEQGVPVYLEKVMVTLQVQGEKDMISYEATPEHKKRFPDQWAYFLAHSKSPRIPLESLPEMRPAIKHAFRELGIRCVEDLVQNDAPGYLAKWKMYAQQIKAVHDRAAGIPKPHVKLQVA